MRCARASPSRGRIPTRSSWPPIPWWSSMVASSANPPIRRSRPPPAPAQRSDSRRRLVRFHRSPARWQIGKFHRLITGRFQKTQRPNDRRIPRPRSIRSTKPGPTPRREKGARSSRASWVRAATSSACPWKRRGRRWPASGLGARLRLTNLRDFVLFRERRAACFPPLPLQDPVEIPDDEAIDRQDDDHDRAWMEDGVADFEGDRASRLPSTIRSSAQRFWK